ncbi:MAG: isoleucine--tRNA ligase, partial [Chloroflexi bacterium]|nr:isoleucine--tRNA ligase [Chloroflexota bacterium]
YYHTYPFCWRCSSPLLYYAKPSWYLRTAAVKELLVQRNGEINWYPEHIKEGRFGEWLRNNVDWAISRERYWGTPLPFWQCAGCGRYQCIGSVQELRELAVPPTRSLVYSSGLDLHRPYVDNVILRCEKCRGEMHRIPEVLDVWFDSGAMPLAQHHYPFENDAILTDGRYPGDYICEAVDQTRGWFYSLHAIAALLEHATDGRIKAPSYRNVICLGLVLDEKGEKMSKSRGNVVDPWSVINAHGADAVRWYLFTATQPGESRRFSTALVGDVVRRFFLTLWNTYAFFVTYANLDRFDPRAETPAKPANDLDRWVLSELNSLVAEVTESLERYDPTGAGRRIEEFVELLSTWYVRRSRRRFWKSGDDQDKRAALQTLYTCLATLAKLLAPLTPFLAEELYGNLVRSVDSKAPESVHLAPWPEADRSLIDPELGQAVRLAMRVVSLGRAARNKARIKVRQPLQAVLVKARTPEEEKALLLRVKDQVADELNVKELRLLRDVSEVVSFRISPNMAALGQKYGRRAREAAEALGKLDPAEVAQKVQAGAPVQAGKFTLLTEEVNLATQEAAGMSVAMEEGYTVAVTTEMTAELREEGLARELVHRLQNMRRAAGLDISDRIHTFYQGPEALRSAFLRHADYIAGETLSLKLVEGPPPDDAYMEQQKLDGMEVTLGIRKASQTPGVPGP